MRSLISVASLVSAVVVLACNPALADTLYCSTFQGIRTCSSPDGYVSHESTWNGRARGTV